MSRLVQRICPVLLICAVGLLWTVSVMGADEPSPVSIANGNIKMKAPTDWIRKEPRVRIIDAEFSVPAVEGDTADARCTVMGAGGSVQANIDRWVGQFSKTTRNKSEKRKIAGQEVHVVDLAGTYKDQRGPFAPAVQREGYRMLGAIIVTEKRGQYFVKLYGPEATMKTSEKAFQAMLNSLEVN